MIRRLLNRLTAVSLLLWVRTAVLRVRSYWGAGNVGGVCPECGNAPEGG